MTAGRAPDDRSVAVMIAAYRASAWITDAVRSALAQPECAEVIVVDDASGDDTADVALAAGDGDPRLTVLRQPFNAGPAAARNAAIAASTAPWLAVLDADDILLPGRFQRLFDQAGAADMIADNILFVAPETRIGTPLPSLPPGAGGGQARVTDLLTYMQGAGTARGKSRGEWGFLKPVMSRAFLDRHGLRYDPSMRLGEDHDLYVRILHAGARFSVVPSVGYAARWVAGSLSERHSLDDLAQLVAAAARHAALPDHPPAIRAAMQSHLRELDHRHGMLALMHKAHRIGRVPAFLSGLVKPEHGYRALMSVLTEKLRRPASKPAPRIGELLIMPQVFGSAER